MSKYESQITHCRSIMILNDVPYDMRSNERNSDNEAGMGDAIKNAGLETLQKEI